MAAGSCSDDYDERFDKLDQQLQNVISQVEGASELSAAISALEAQITTLKNAVGELPDGDALTGGLSSLESQITALEAELAALAETGATSEELATLVAGLTSDLDLLKGDLGELLENSNVLTGDLVIFDQNSLDAALTLGDRVAIVNGWVQILADDLDAEALNAVTSKIVAVTASMYVQTDKELDFSNLESVGDILGVVGNEVDLSGLKSVGDDLEISWDGDYDFPGLTLVGNTIRLGVEGDGQPCKCAKTGKAASRIINFRNVKAADVQVLYGAYMELDSGVYDMYSDWDTNSSLLEFPNATSVIFGDVPVRFVIAPIAETIELHYEGILPGIEGPGLIVYSSATNVTAKASEIVGDIEILALGDTEIFVEFSNYDGSNATPDEVLSNFEFPSDWVSQINLPNLEAVDGDMSLVSHALSMPLLEEFDIENDGYELVLTQENISLPNLTVEGKLYVAGTVTAELASISDTYIQDSSILESLKLNAQLNDATAQTIGVYNYEALTSLTIIGSTDLEGDDAIVVDLQGSVATKGPIGFNVPVLKTVILGGNINRVSVNSFPALTTLTTSGNINDLYIANNQALVTLTLGHEHIAGLDGANLRVEYNDALESLVTQKLDYVTYLYVYENESLSNMDLSSMKTAVNAYSDGYDVGIYIQGNNLSGTFVEYVAQSGTTAEQLGVLNSKDLYSLKALIDALEDSDLDFDYDIYVDNVVDLDGDPVPGDDINIELGSSLGWTWSSEADVINFDNYYWE